jgi:hypothetical protein
VALAAPAPAWAAPQPPHDSSAGTACIDCHIPYGGLTDPQHFVSGAATGGSATTLELAGQGWTASQWRGAAVTFTSGANAGSHRIVSASGASSVSWVEPFDSAVVAGDAFSLNKVTYADIENRCKVCHTLGGRAGGMPDVGLHVVDAGATVIGCGKCHDPHNVSPNTGRNAGLIRLAVRWPTVQTEVAYPASPTNPLIATVPPYAGICQVCHTATRYHRNDGTGAAHFPDQVCTATCHPHGNQFRHGVGTNCDTCHGHDAGYPIGGGAVSAGAGTFQSHSTHTENDDDDLKGPNLACDACHDPSAFPSFRSGTDLNADGRIDLAETDVCASCHGPGGDYDGVDGPEIGARSRWAAGVYAGNALRPGAERWCAGCHDREAPSIATVRAPNVVGDETANTDWGATGYGFYRTGHGVPATQAFPWTVSPGSPYERPGAGRSCLDCHDPGQAHIDGVARTYAASARTPATYQAGYRLRGVAGGPPLEIPRVYQAGDPLVSADEFGLCLNAGCHISGPFVNASDYRTNFRNLVTGINAHVSHLQALDAPGPVFRSDWSGGAGDSRATCIQCHDPHGATQLSMIRGGHDPVSDFGKPQRLRVSYAQWPGSIPAGLTLPDSTATAVYASDPLPGPGSLCASNQCHLPGPGYFFYRRTPFPPTLTAAYGAASSAEVTLFFSDQVTAAGGLALGVGELALLDAGGLTISAVAHVAGGSWATVTLSAPLGGLLGSAAIGPATGASIFDPLGIAVAAGARVTIGTDGAPPALSVISPADLDENVPRAVNASDGNGNPQALVIELGVSDTAIGVDISTLTVSLTSPTGPYARSYSAAAPGHPGLDWSGDPMSYTVSVRPDLALPRNATVTATVTVRDFAGNLLAAGNSWSFTTVDQVLTQLLYPRDPHDPTSALATSPVGATWPEALATGDGTAVLRAPAGAASTSTFWTELEDGTPITGTATQLRVSAWVAVSFAGAPPRTYTNTLATETSGGTPITTSAPSTTYASNNQRRLIRSGWLAPGVALDATALVGMRVRFGRATTDHTDSIDQLYVEVQSP